MAKVYTGKVAIPGDKFVEYLKLMEEAQKEREPFKRKLVGLNEEFHDYLLQKYSERTAQKHSTIINLFIDFICRQTDVESIEEITRGMVNTHFKKWWKRKVWDSTTPDELRVALKKFFKFFETEKGIFNTKAMTGLQ
jgi:site-specific recombinase XerD